MAVLKETRSFRPFKSSEEYLYAMKEDLAEWLNMLYPELMINVDNFMDRLDTGVALCKHANSVRKSAEEYLARRAARKMSMSTSTISTIALPITNHGAVSFLKAAKAGTFFARDNVSNFIDWCRKGLGVFECLLFETDDLIMRKNEKHVILCLLDVARRGAKFGMLAPMLVQLEREIDREIAAEQRALQRANSCEEGEGYVSEEEDEMEQEEYNVQYGPMPQIITNDLKSLDEMVRDLVERCHCPVQFPMIRVSEGKYRIGDTKVLIFVRILRNHVMVRVGGGWDTLSHYLDKHDPCRCKTAHRSPLSAKLILKNAGNSMELNHAQVHYERSPPRTRRSSASSISSGEPRVESYATLNAPTSGRTSRNRSRSPTPRRSVHNASLAAPKASYHADGRTTPNRNRSRSPTPRRGLQPTNGRTTPRTRSRSPNPTRNVNRKPSNVTVNGGVQQEVADNNNVVVTHAKAENDSGSEVSDEGYRSLGLVIVTNPAVTNDSTVVKSGKVFVNGEERVLEKRGSVDSARSKRASFSSNCSNDEADVSATDGAKIVTTPTGTLIKITDTDVTPMNVDDTVQCGYASSRRSSDGTSKRSLTDTTKYGKENNPGQDGSPKRAAQKTSLPDRRRMSQSPVAVNRNPTTRMSRSRSIDNGEEFDDSSVGLSPRKSQVYRSLKTDPRTANPTPSSWSKATARSTTQNGTWSSRAKTRPALTPNTFAGNGQKGGGLGVRNSPLRSSLGSYGSAPSSPAKKANAVKNPGSVSLTTSPTREISPLVKQILDVNDLGDDAKVLDKMKEIIQHYKDIVDERLMEETKCEAGSRLPQGPELDFTSEWVHNNGSIQGMQQLGPKNDALEAARIQASPRKDSKTESFTSKIPAPVSHRTNSIDIGRDS